MADDICQHLLRKHPRLEELTVSIKKPQVAVPGVVDYLGIQITRSRDSYLTK